MSHTEIIIIICQSQIIRFLNVFTSLTREYTHFLKSLVEDFFCTYPSPLTKQARLQRKAKRIIIANNNEVLPKVNLMA